MTMIFFEDRREAGILLAERLQALAGRDCVVLGLPRGGVPVAYEVARKLPAPLDVFLVAALGAPMSPQFAIGTIASGGVRVVDAEQAWKLGMTGFDIGRIETRERAELSRREELYRQSHPAEPIKGRTVVIVDDGIATGSTMSSVARAVRLAGAGRIVVAAPVIAADAIAGLGRVADEVVCVAAPSLVLSVSSFYCSFPKTSDAEVRRVIALAREY